MVSDIPAWDGEMAKLFLTVYRRFDVKSIIKTGGSRKMFKTKTTAAS